MMVAFLVLAAGLVARFGAGAGMLPAALGALTRVNGVFAAPVLLLPTRWGPVQTVVASVVAAAILLPVAGVVNRSILGASRSHVEKSLQLFDIAGTGQGPFARCYSSFYWDTLQNHCRAFDRTPDDMSGLWVRAILDRPAAYAWHRLT